MAIFIDDPKVAGGAEKVIPPVITRFETGKSSSNPGAGGDAPSQVQALVEILRNRSYEEIRQRMYDSAPGSAWWSACKAELELRNGKQMAESSLAMSRTSEKMRASTQHFEQLADTLNEATSNLAELLRGTHEAGRRLEIAVYVTIGVTLVQLFNLVFEVFHRR